MNETRQKASAFWHTISELPPARGFVWFRCAPGLFVWFRINLARLRLVRVIVARFIFAWLLLAWVGFAWVGLIWIFMARIVVTGLVTFPVLAFPLLTFPTLILIIHLKAPCKQSWIDCKEYSARYMPK